MTCGAPSCTYATRLLVVPRSIPTTFDIRNVRGSRGTQSCTSASAPFAASASPSCELALDTYEQVVDVVAFQHPFAQRLEDRAAVCRRCALVEQRVPPLRQRFQLFFVL